MSNEHLADNCVNHPNRQAVHYFRHPSKPYTDPLCSECYEEYREKEHLQELKEHAEYTDRVSSLQFCSSCGEEVYNEPYRAVVLCGNCLSEREIQRVRSNIA